MISFAPVYLIGCLSFLEPWSVVKNNAEAVGLEDYGWSIMTRVLIRSIIREKKGIPV